MKRKHKRLLARIIVSSVLLCVSALFAHFLELDPLICLFVYMVPYLIAGYDVLRDAARNIIKGRVFDENFLMCIATVGAFATGEYPEAVFVMVFYQIGELFQSIAVGKSRRSIAALMDIKPETARVRRNGEETIVSPEEVKVGETVIVRAGEKIPLDGTVTSGTSELNCMALTGESVPRYTEVGMNVVGGCVNLSGTLEIKVESEYENSTVAKILALVEDAASVKAKTDKFITKFARYYTPIVVLCAVLVAFIPSIITGDFALWIGRALVFLVISCPCALVISVPLSYFGGLGAASKKGILIKGACYLESLAQTGCVVFDKTGTLTKGSFAVVSEKRAVDRELFYGTAYALENDSNHPIALAVCRYCRPFASENAMRFDSITERSGLGKVGVKNGTEYFAGNIRLAKLFGIDAEESQESGSLVYVGQRGKLYGVFTVKDELKETAASVIEDIKALGVDKTVMLSGDRRICAEDIAARLGIDEAHGELLPEDKVRELESIIAASQGKKVIYVGDGINDAPVLTRADIGISMGALGSDAAIEAADVVLMDDDPKRIADALRIARATRNIVIQNIVFALGIKVLFMLLGALGIAGLWLAVFADVGVSVIAILNSMRTLKIK